MKRILKHQEFLKRRDLSEPIDESIKMDLINLSLNEGSVLDSLKNSLDKTIFGKLSRLSIIDRIRRSNLDIQKEIINKEYEAKEDIAALEVKMDTLRKRGADKKEFLQIEQEIERKKKEFSAYIKMQKAKMDQGINLLDKTIANNERRREYYEAGAADDKFEIAKFEYELAKNKTSDKEEVDKLKNKFEEAAKKAEEMIKNSMDSAKKSSKKSLSAQELSDLSALRKTISENDADTIIDLKQKTADRSDELKAKLSDGLKDLVSFIKKMHAKRVPVSDRVIEKKLEPLVKLSNEIDACDNLYRLYSKMGKSRSQISKSISTTSSLSDLFTKINSAILDGKDAGSGLTSMLLVLEADPTADNIQKVIKKIA